MTIIQDSAQKIAVIGSGIAGLSAGQLLKNSFQVTVFEQQPNPGGLIKCNRIRGNLFHRVGGHVFNSQNQDVLNWFWNFFDRDKEFLKAKRNAKIWMDGKLVGYPLENHLWQLDRQVAETVLDELLAIHGSETNAKTVEANNFQDFLKARFGETLFQIYFGPYNQKIWNTPLKDVPLGWLDGKLPMPKLKQILSSNIIRQEEAGMVHATFYYPKDDGSQFIVNRLAQGLDIHTSTTVTALEKTQTGWLVNGEPFSKVIFTGDVRTLVHTLQEVEPSIFEAIEAVKNLPSNGTSNLLCETDETDISWLYLSDPDVLAHRIIYTGGFSSSNNRGNGRMSCVVEFSGSHKPKTMEEEIGKLPGNLSPLGHNYEPNSYVIQQPNTRALIEKLKGLLEPHGMYLAGRFAEWEYYNMDKAIEASMKVACKICS